MYGPFDIDYRSFIKNKKKPIAMGLGLLDYSHPCYSNYTTNEKFQIEEAIFEINKHFNYFGYPDPNVNNIINTYFKVYSTIHYDIIQISEYQKLCARSQINREYMDLSGKNLFRNNNVIKNGTIGGLFKMINCGSYRRKKEFLHTIEPADEKEWIDYYATFGYTP